MQRRGDKAYVYVVEGDRAKLREIVPGEGQNGSLVVKEGLAEGELLVIRGHNLLFDGALVRVSGVGTASSPEKTAEK